MLGPLHVLAGFGHYTQMAHDPKTEAWLAARQIGNSERLKQEEKEVADLWWDSLNSEQKQVYGELASSEHGLDRLRERANLERRSGGGGFVLVVLLALAFGAGCMVHRYGIDQLLHAPGAP